MKNTIIDIDKLKSVEIDLTKYTEVKQNDYYMKRDEIYNLRTDSWDEIEHFRIGITRGSLINPVRRKIST